MKKIITIATGVLMGSISCFSSNSIYVNSQLDKTSRDDSDVSQGEQVTQVLDLKDFKKLVVMIPAQVNIHQGETQKIVVTSSSDVSEFLNQSVHNNKWRINFGLRNISWNNEMNSGSPEIIMSRTKVKLINHAKITIDITIPHLDGVTVYGSGNINIDDFVNEESLDLKVMGSGNITSNGFEGSQKLKMALYGNGDIDIETFTGFNKFKANIWGGGDVSIKNTTVSDFKIKTRGRGDCDCDGLMTKKSEIRVYGSGDVSVSVADALNVVLLGAGSVTYNGNGNLDNQIALGGGSIYKTN